VLASLDQSLQRLGLDYVDIFYSHRFDPDTPLEETMGALATAVQQGKALYVGISSYSPGKTREAAKLLNGMGVRCLIHQPAYNMFNRWIEEKEHNLLGALAETGMGCIAFSCWHRACCRRNISAASGRGAHQPPGGGSLKKDHLKPENIAHIKALNEIAKKRGQSLAQMALAWTLRDKRVTSALLGASSAEQIKENVGALKKLDFSAAELAEIDKHAVDLGINLWRSRAPTSGLKTLIGRNKNRMS
jgi:L-glyceraldehyde 3-phosphate reductase